MDNQLIVRLIVSIIAAINAGCAMFGLPQLEVTEGMIYTVVSFAAMIGAWVWGFWKNNNFTEAAKKGQEVVDAEKRNA